MQPADTAPRIAWNQAAPADSQITRYGYGKHYINQTGIKSTSDFSRSLVIFLPGSGATPSEYEIVADHLAYKGFASIGLAYVNNSTVSGDQGCGHPELVTNNKQDPCFTATRGETAFGKNIVYGGGPYNNSAYQVPGFNGNDIKDVNPGDSIMNRLICLLDYLAHQAADSNNPYPAYWAQFLIDDTNAPYIAPFSSSTSTDPSYTRRVRVDWSRIVLAGHSQGGGHAAFMGLRLPQVPKRVVLMSAPQDNLGTVSAQWITQPPLAANGSASTATSLLGRFWGIRNAAATGEGIFGNFVTTNWLNLGGSSLGGLGGNGLAEQSVGDGSSLPDTPTHRLMLAQPTGISDASRHSSTAVDINLLNTNTASLTTLVLPILDSYDLMFGAP